MDALIENVGRFFDERAQRMAAALVSR